jgi:hypothetical protein
MKSFWNRRSLDLEGELRARRPQPRADFVKTLATEVRSTSPERTRAGRFGVAIALSGLILVVLASFGGIGYASSAASHAVKQPNAAREVQSSAAAQYKPFTPPKAKPPKQAVAPAAPKPAPQGASPTVTSSQLPFTGLALWMPLAIGLLLLATGLVLRTRSRRRGPSTRS